VIQRLDDDTATVQTIGKEVDGVLEPATEPVTMVRADEEPAGVAGETPAATATAPTSTEVQP
jgi:hypothetical protein